MLLLRQWLALCAITMQFACLHPASEHCGSGGLCPAGQQCAATGAQRICVLVTCGNGRLDPDEVCDDGNNRSGDGCPADCKDPCGDGVLDPGELCDDGNTADGDGCAADCRSLDGGFTLMPGEVIFTAREGESPPVAVTVTARVAYLGDTVVFGYPAGMPPPTWLSITENTDAGGAATFTLEPVDTLVAGERSTHVRFVARHQSSSSLSSFDLPVSYYIEPSDLTLQTTSTSVEFRAASGGQLPLPSTVSLMFNGPDVAVIAAPLWVTVTPPAAPVTSPASFSIAINTTALPAGTLLSGDVRFATTRGNVERTVTVHVSYRVVSSLPEVRFVAPYVGLAGRGGTVHVRGIDFPTSGITATVGGTPLGEVHPDSDTQITLSYPPLSEGRYIVSLAPDGSAVSRAELVIITPTQLTYQAIDAPSLRTHIVYDPERQTIYGVNQLDQQIELFVYADGNWWTPPPWSVPLLRDIALTTDGRSLIATDRDAINEISLVSGVSWPIVRARYTGDRSCGEGFDQASATDSGTIFVTTQRTNCSDATGGILYDVEDYSVRGIAHTDAGHLAGSADGSRIYLAGNGVSSSVVVFDSLSGTAFDSTQHVNTNDIIVSGDGSRVIGDNSNVYDGSLNLLGSIPFRGTALASRDSRRAFMYILDNEGSAHLEIYDLTAPLDENGFYPRIRTMMLADTASAVGESSVVHMAMTTSLDDRVVFISGDRKLLVVPVE